MRSARTIRSTVGSIGWRHSGGAQTGDLFCAKSNFRVNGESTRRFGNFDVHCTREGVNEQIVIIAALIGRIDSEALRERARDVALTTRAEKNRGKSPDLGDVFGVINPPSDSRVASENRAFARPRQRSIFVPFPPSPPIQPAFSLGHPLSHLKGTQNQRGRGVEPRTLAC